MMVSKHFNNKQRKMVNGRSAAVIRYDENSFGPQVVAHGKGYVANQIIELANKNNIYLQEDAMLVENLLDMDLGDNIPPQLYAVMAEILLLIEEMENNY
ncbi:EscU/YscU/HrcU family type III secretion system export apparatus switch protein [Anaerobacillus sp. CMMVII]|uniref:EscU/YscU/HrcU family type III secretion system export apparatus switch protein n=1 Tax=Anaerobacillus sp. CMMVII TaxID=2755588 RepID=UPI0021B7B1C5|nr:EscU/YscU/HrcU family type III secretion system export apparatus switch protein [Anaerobacillus sp. CMMVII]MCT8138743.1 EscU/YscU/HrcU family type III secretion system export apparatus switch protein [Anaerobacillus sp. CMMVII]